MRVSRAQAAESRERILDAAARLFRERGFDGIGVADLMRQAGLTHGGFYSHFASKEDLMVQACAHALTQAGPLWRGQERQTGDAAVDPLAALATGYLSKRHRDRPGSGCAVAALAVDASRQGRKLRRVLTAGMCEQIEVLTGLMSGDSEQARHEAALAAYAALVGALVLARAADDRQLSEGFLRAAAQSVMAAGPAGRTRSAADDV
jgi:TetR/AcrR family transcriptional repressor of nem operon